MPCVAECSDGGNSHMGTAHSDASQGKCLQLLIPLPSSVSFVFAILKMLYVCVFSTFYSLPVHLSIHLVFLSYTERASCSSSRMCSSETIVKEPRWQETRLRKTKNQRPLPYYLVSFPSCWQHSLPFKTTSGKEVHDCSTPCAFCPVSHVSMIVINPVAEIRRHC